uniref:Uncharacterized protein n=1 Tax=Arundo donax TaxID=35708 RepID=A0A0A9BB90_ARUDO
MGLTWSTLVAGSKLTQRLGGLAGSSAPSSMASG